MDELLETKSSSLSAFSLPGLQIREKKEKQPTKLETTSYSQAMILAWLSSQPQILAQLYIFELQSAFYANTCQA